MQWNGRFPKAGRARGTAALDSGLKAGLESARQGYRASSSRERFAVPALPSEINFASCARARSYDAGDSSHANQDWTNGAISRSAASAWPARCRIARYLPPERHAAPVQDPGHAVPPRDPGRHAVVQQRKIGVPPRRRLRLAQSRIRPILPAKRRQQSPEPRSLSWPRFGRRGVPRPASRSCRSGSRGPASPAIDSAGGPCPGTPS